MKKKYGNSKSRYSDFLTVLLVLVIIAILALIGFFGYKAINKKSIEVGSQNAFDTFQNSVKNKVVQNTVENEVVENEVVKVAATNNTSSTAYSLIYPPEFTVFTVYSYSPSLS